MFPRGSGRWHGEGESARLRPRGGPSWHAEEGDVAAALGGGALLRLPAVLRGGHIDPRPALEAAGAGGGRGRVDRGKRRQVRLLRCRVLARLLLLGGEVEARLRRFA